MSSTVRTILVPFDGSANAKRALDYAIELAGPGSEEVHVLNVQMPLSGDVSGFVGGANVRQYHHDEGEKVLAAARRQLEKAGIAFHGHIGVGQPGPVISDFAEQLKCTHVVMGTRGGGSTLGNLLGSTASHVVGHVKAPITLVR
jgi:nucleotide-binding universal stress UspA family protein